MTHRQQLIDWIFATLRESARAPLSVLIFYLIGRSLRLYEIIPSLDIPTHFIGGVAITYFTDLQSETLKESLVLYPFQFKSFLLSHAQGLRSFFGNSMRTCSAIFSALIWRVALKIRSWTCFWVCWVLWSYQPFIAAANSIV